MAVFAVLASWWHCSLSVYVAYSIQVAVLLFASNQIVSWVLLPPWSATLSSSRGVLLAPGVPVASQPAAICSVYCHMLHMQPLCSQMQPTGSQMHPPDVKYQPLCNPSANQPAAICSVYCNTAAYEGPVQPNAAHRRPNAPPRCIISAPMQPKPIPMSPLATKFGTHGKPNYHPRTKNAPD